MKPRTLLVLLVLVLGLGTFIWFYERKLPSSEERTEQSKKVLPIDTAEVTAVTLESESGTLKLEKVILPVPKDDEKKEKEGENGDEDALAAEPPAEWRIVEPLKARADTFVVEGLLDALAALDKVRTLDELDPKQVGLDKPRATVRITTADGEKVLKIGAEIPTSATTIASVSGVEGNEGALVISDSILTEIRRAPGEWRDRQLFRGDRDKIRRITLTAAGQRVVLVAQNGAFRMESPLRDRVDRDKIDDLFAELSGLTAERFVEGAQPTPEMGIQPPRAVVEVAAEGAQPFRIELGGETETIGGEPPPPDPGQSPGPTPPAKTFYARADGQLVEVRTRLEDAALRPAAEWRSTALSSLETFEVESATVQDAQGTLSLERAEPEWKRGKDTISYLPVSDFLFSLLGVTADRLVTPAEAVSIGVLPGGKPLLTVTLKTKERGDEILKLFAPVAAGVPATAGDRQLVLLLPPGTLGEIQAKLAEVRKASPIDPSKDPTKK